MKSQWKSIIMHYIANIDNMLKIVPTLLFVATFFGVG